MHGHWPAIGIRQRDIKASNTMMKIITCIAKQAYCLLPNCLFEDWTSCNGAALESQVGDVTLLKCLNIALDPSPNNAESWNEDELRMARMSVFIMSESAMMRTLNLIQKIVRFGKVIMRQSRIQVTSGFVHSGSNFAFF